MNQSALQLPTSPISLEAAGQTVLLVSHEFLPFRGGVATYVQEIASAARRLGYPVAVWTVDDGSRDSTWNDRECKVHVLDSSTVSPVVRLSSSGRLTPGGLLSFVWGFWRRRGEWQGKPVILLSVGAQMAFFLLSLVGCGARGATCVFHGSEILRFRRNPFWRWLARRFYRREAGRFAVTTRYVETLLLESGVLPRNAEVVLAPCALPAMFHVEQEKTGFEVGAWTGKDLSGWHVLTVARLHPRKGQLEVARALGLLSAEHRANIIYQMVGVGDADYREQVEVTCRAGGVRCEFLGALNASALGTAYVQATVYAQASRTLPQSVEGFGITFLEAAACGCPVAAWKTGGVTEAVLDGETGLLVDEGDVVGLSEAVGRLLRDEELRRKLGNRGREFARTFSWEQTARTLCEPLPHRKQN